MRDSNNSVSRRIAGGIMGVMLLLLVLFSAFYIAIEATHDCSGEGCPVCACIQQCEETLSRIGSGSVVQTALIAPVAALLLYVLIPQWNLTSGTPVSDKVRLNH